MFWTEGGGMRRIWIGVAVALTWVASIETGRARNDIGHRLYVETAIDALPKPLKGFYEGHKVTLAAAVSDPSRFGRSIFEVDRPEPFPFPDLPTDRGPAGRQS